MCMEYHSQYILAFADIQKTHVDVDTIIKRHIQDVEQVTERLTGKITNKETGEVLLYRLKGQWGEIGDNRMRATKKLGELEDAEEDGRLVVLPCKVGQDLFGIYNGTIVDGYADGYLLEKTSVHSDADHLIWLQDKNSKNYWKISFAEIGKTVFFTREKAEKALKEMEGKQGE